MGIEDDNGDTAYREKDEIKIMQCVGYKDKNGDDIFEGDIVRTDEAGWIAKVDSIRSCIDDEGGFSFDPHWEGCEIMGNIQENPELIKLLSRTDWKNLENI